jgi:hypothetical protein
MELSVNYMAIWKFFMAIPFLWPFGTLCGHFGNFSNFGMLRQEKSGNPARNVFCAFFLHACPSN